MASDEAVLLVRIEAQMRQFERAMARASGVANTTAGRIETRFRAMDRTLGRIGVGLGRSLIGPLAALASVHGIGAAVNAFQRIENALKVAGLEGEELAKTFTKLKNIAIQNGAPIESLAQLYSRLSIAQEGLGVNSAQILSLVKGVGAALRISGKSAEEARGALLQLSQALGSGIVRGEEFNAILDGLLPVAQAAARGLKEAGGDVTKLRRLIVDGKVSSEAFFRAFQVGQPAIEALAKTTDITLNQALTNLQTETIGALGRLDDLSGGSATLIGVMNRLGPAIDRVVGFIESLSSTHPPSWFPDWLINGAQIGDIAPPSQTNPLFSDLVDDAIKAKDAIEAVEAAKQAVRDAGPIHAADVIALPEIQEGADAAADRVVQAFADAGERITPVSIEEFPVLPPPRTPGGGGARTPEEQFADDIAGIQARTAALRIETEVVGRSTFEQEHALAVHALLNEARKAGLKITPDIRIAIEAEATAYARAATALEQTEDRFRAINDLALEFGGQAIDAFESLLDGTKSLNESLSDSVKIIRRMVLEALLLGQGPLANLFGTAGVGGGTGGTIGNLIGGLFGGGGAQAAGVTTAATQLAGSSLASVASTAAGASQHTPTVVQLVVGPGQMFEPTVAAISGAVSVQTVRTNNRGIPAMVANRQARGV